MRVTLVKVHIDVDVGGYRPEQGKLDREGVEVEDRLYNQKDYDRTLVIDERTSLVAQKVSDFLKESGDRFQKTIVFCVDEEHAARMRQALVNENADLCEQNHRYVMRITGSDAEGQAQLGNFIDPESRYPVIVTTSRLLSTGVDAQTCRVIALDRAVGSMTEFKQIVGRGTRVHEDTKKYYFTIIDFRGATSHFDLICHVAFDRPPLTRRERADNVRKRDVFTKYGPRARAVLEALLQKYQDEGVLALDDPRILQIPPFVSMGTPLELIKHFGVRADFERAVHELQDALYHGAA